LIFHWDDFLCLLTFELAADFPLIGNDQEVLHLSFFLAERHSVALLVLSMIWLFPVKVKP
jgi:hypothetical protein